MEVLPPVFILFLGAFCIPFHTPERRWLRAITSLSPWIALAFLLIPFPFPDSFSIFWQPASLFPEPLLFRSHPASVQFAICFCFLIILIEWTRPMRRSSSLRARMFVFLLAISAMLSFFSANALSLVLTWTGIDILTFIAILFLESPAEIGPDGISTSVSRSISILAMHLLSNALVLLPALESADLEWTKVWSGSPSDIALALFLAGILLRLLVVPIHLSLSRFSTSSAGLDTLLRILSPAMVFSLLSRAWPGEMLLSTSSPVRMVLILIAAMTMLVGGFQWGFSSSAYGRRDIFLLMLSGVAILSALQSPQPDIVFQAVGSMLILGGGILLFYRGQLGHRRWMFLWPLWLAILVSGIFFSPLASVISDSYLRMMMDGNFILLAVLILGQVLMIVSLLRLAFETTEEFSADESFYIFQYSLGMTFSAGVLLYTGLLERTSFDPVRLVVPLIVFSSSAILSLLISRFWRTKGNLPPLMDDLFRLEWLQPSLSFAFQKSAGILSGIEGLLSGEGAMLWALAVTLILFIVLRGG